MENNVFISLPQFQMALKSGKFNISTSGDFFVGGNKYKVQFHPNDKGINAIRQTTHIDGNKFRQYAHTLFRVIAEFFTQRLFDYSLSSRDARVNQIVQMEYATIKRTTDVTAFCLHARKQNVLAESIEKPTILVRSFLM